MQQLVLFPLVCSGSLCATDLLLQEVKDQAVDSCWLILMDLVLRLRYGVSDAVLCMHGNITHRGTSLKDPGMHIHV